MINNPQVPGIQSEVEKERRSHNRISGVFAPTTMATALLVAAIVGMAVTSLMQGNQPATAESDTPLQPVLAALSVPLDSGEGGAPSSHGYLEYESFVDGRVPGFDQMPRRAVAQ